MFSSLQSAFAIRRRQLSLQSKHRDLKLSSTIKSNRCVQFQQNLIPAARICKRDVYCTSRGHLGWQKPKCEGDRAAPNNRNGGKKKNTITKCCSKLRLSLPFLSGGIYSRCTVAWEEWCTAACRAPGAGYRGLFAATVTHAHLTQFESSFFVHMLNPTHHVNGITGNCGFLNETPPAHIICLCIQIYSLYIAYEGGS